MLKRCNKCGIDKPVDDFPIRNLGAGGYRRRGTCKRCITIRSICKRFGITIEEYHQLFSEHEGKCAICRQPCPSGNSLCIDHDHDTGEIRGLLCINCNKGLGHFQDDSDLLERAIFYLGSRK